MRKKMQRKGWHKRNGSWDKKQMTYGLKNENVEYFCRSGTTSQCWQKVGESRQNLSISIILHLWMALPCDFESLQYFACVFILFKSVKCAQMTQKLKSNLKKTRLYFSVERMSVELEVCHFLIIRLFCCFSAFRKCSKSLLNSLS